LTLVIAVLGNLKLSVYGVVPALVDQMPTLKRSLFPELPWSWKETPGLTFVTIHWPLIDAGRFVVRSVTPAMATCVTPSTSPAVRGVLMVNGSPGVVTMLLIDLGAAAGASLDRTMYWGGANVKVPAVATVTATGRLSSTVLAMGFVGSKLESK